MDAAQETRVCYAWEASASAYLSTHISPPFALMMRGERPCVNLLRRPVFLIVWIASGLVLTARLVPVRFRPGGAPDTARARASCRLRSSWSTS